MDEDALFAHFAYVLLSGQVVLTDILDSLIKKKCLLAAPESVLEGSNLAPRVTRLVSTLRKWQIDSKAKLITFWRTKDVSFLHDILSLWFNAKGQAELK